MKTIVPIAILILLVSCGKETIPITSQWIIKNNTYYGGLGTCDSSRNPYYPFNYYGFLNNNDLVNELTIFFKIPPHKTGAYKIISSIPTDTSTCFIALDLSAPSNITYNSMGEINDSIHIAIDSNKTIMTITNIYFRNLSNSNDTTTVSGTLTTAQ
jgi:hypothetical protein